MRRLALVTDAEGIPIDYDMPLLLRACQTVGLNAEVCSWDDPAVDWPSFGAVVLRSPWSYAERLPEFLAWCERTAAVTDLLNPVSAARWSLDKLYLADLAACGVPVVPSEFIAPGADSLGALQKFLTAHPEADEVVVKPTVGHSSIGAQRYSRALEAEAVRHIDRLLADGCQVVLQPYLDSIDSEGETDLIYFDGVYSHAIRKSALLMPDGTVNPPKQEFRKARVADEDEQKVALAVLDAVASQLRLERPLLYARVDLIRGGDGQPMVLEAELCEPSLSLPFAEGSDLRFARAIARRLLT